MNSKIHLVLFLLLFMPIGLLAKDKPIHVAIFDGDGVGPSAIPLIAAIQEAKDHPFQISRIMTAVMKHLITIAALLLAAPASLHAAEPSAVLMQRIMKAADKNKDGKLSLEEYKALDVQALHHGEEHFKAGNTNYDDFIEATELAGALSKQTWFAILSEGTEPCFARIDVNKDGKLDATEYRKISKMGQHSEQHFKGADANKDSFLDLAEFTAHAEQKLETLEKDSARKIAGK